MKNKELEKLLLRRAFDVTKLARQIFAGRSHLTQVLQGARCGSQTWPKLKSVLTPQEYKVAHEYAEAERERRKQAGKRVEIGSFAT